MKQESEKRPKAKPNRMTFTHIPLRRLKPKDRQFMIWDKGTPGQKGLGVLVSPGGTKSFRSTYYFPGSPKAHSRKLGRFPDMTIGEARDLAREDRRKAADGIDPKREWARTTGAMFEAVFEDWMRRDQANNKTAHETRRALERDVLPEWHGRSIHDIKRRDVIALIDGIADRGAVTMARRVHAHLHRLFKWATGRAIIEVNPMADLPKPGKENPRDRWLDDTELIHVWHATRTLGYPYGHVFRLLILTGCRRSEIAELQWSELDREAALILLEGARTKNGDPRTVPLSPAALRIVGELRHKHYVKPVGDAPEYVFTTMRRTPISGWRQAKTLLDDAAIQVRRKLAVNAGDDPDAVKGLPPWRIHDLRRSVATGLQKLGERLEVIEAVLGHTSGSRAGIVGVYQRHAFEPEKRKALDAWARHVTSLIEGRKDNVVVLPA